MFSTQIYEGIAEAPMFEVSVNWVYVQEVVKGKLEQ